ncbi:MAG: hypothetical protein VX043_04615 [Candidatus Thermoplasmatota archaeon]|nr:hypothetical protein [Candidatus Thermoplasmatota archaeon]MEC8249785.1 hypothetical protein [Candidatus Thermoplasmatota archaeon]MEC8258757.1 hypothetical protein [Candidatus Thermoplasmatota archaeon]MEC8312732.1 hypothetical protein [Candidatus Thermoplasmatota archaeon]
MAEYPTLWYGLWFVISVCGVLTWYLRNFTERVEQTRLTAFVGVIAMTTLLLWTLIDF